MRVDLERCFGTGDSLMADYHDHEWGIPQRDDRALFEKLVLEGFQAGLSWRTILYKRENFRQAFDHFDPERMARYGRRDVDRLLRDAGIVRNRLKIEAAISNARTVLDLQERRGQFLRLPVGIHRSARAAWAAGAQLGPGPHAHVGLRCNGERPQGAWLPLRGNHHLLCIHAVGRHGG